MREIGTDVRERGGEGERGGRGREGKGKRGRRERGGRERGEEGKDNVFYIHNSYIRSLYNTVYEIRHLMLHSAVKTLCNCVVHSVVRPPWYAHVCIPSHVVYMHMYMHVYNMQEASCILVLFIKDGAQPQ